MELLLKRHQWQIGGGGRRGWIGTGAAFSADFSAIGHIVSVALEQKWAQTGSGVPF